VLFHGRPLGANAAVWAVAFVAALAALLRLGHVPLHQGRRFMVAPLVVFAALLAWRDSPLLQAVNLLAVASAVCLGALRRTDRRLAHAEIDDYVAGAVTAGAATIVGAAELMQVDVPWRDMGDRMRRPGVTAFARGLALVFPLLVVVLLVLPLLIGVDAVLKGTPSETRIVRVLSACLILLVGVVIASALQRLWLYQQQFGLTELRVYATGVVLWLAVVFAWLAVTVLRGRRQLFATGAVVAGFAATLCINVVNPDALI